MLHGHNSTLFLKNNDLDTYILEAQEQAHRSLSSHVSTLKGGAPYSRSLRLSRLPAVDKYVWNDSTLKRNR